MQPTVSPWAWVSSWDRRARTRAAGEFARSRDRAGARARDHDKYAFYGLRKDSRHFIRLDPLAKGLLLNHKWVPTSVPVTWRVERAHHTEPWAVPGIKVYYHQSIQSYRPYEPVPIVLPGEAGAPGPLPGAGAQHNAGTLSHAWSSGARGWAAGAVVLALLVLLVRAAENCLHKKLFKAIYAHTNAGAAELSQNEIRPGHYRLQGVRRQESDEWSTPNVMATSLQLQHRDFDTASIDNLDDIEDLPPLGRADMPPPYSEVARPGAPAPAADPAKRTGEEPPPPYSACYVAYSSPKGADPQVHIRRLDDQPDPPHSSTDIDNAQNNLIENGLTSEAATTTTVDVATDIRTELVFDNGRVVERLNYNDDNEAGAASDDNAQEQSTRHGTDRVVYVDETAAENNTTDRALIV
ncbi:hypothetical protein PYW07_010651 [Mythimna separata]|uniref:Uncharacterized protein n=1 Tax=Mythimna separata TaxID=271217 RepID=A0AAD8DMK5_MYTSE|nr:hypothetical protein PYW07_010651 [Mythimna separata]